MTVSQPAWVDYAVWWHCYPLGFTGAERTSVPGDVVHHRLDHLVGWLDYLVSIGCNGLLLGPVFASVSHGYDTVDHYRVDPRLGDEADLRRLVDEAHRRGIRVVLDGVFNHVARTHPLVARAEATGPGTPDGSWVRWVDGYVRCFEGNLDLPELELSTPAVRDYVVAVMEHWLAFGIDGWRLDAAYAPGPEAWAPITARVRADFPEAWLVGEVIHGDLPDFVHRAGVHSVTQYELWKAIRSSLTDRNLFELDWALQRHNGFLEHFTPNTFAGNHDVTRIASAVGAEGAVAALAILMTVGGLPSIYAGDEQAFTGVKEDRPGGDDQIRQAFPDTPEQLAPWGRPVLRAHQDLIGLRRRHPWLTTASTERINLTNTRYAYRVRERDGRAFLDVVVDLAGTPAVTIADDTGLLWSQQR